MDTTLKQRILGVIVLVGLLGFCLTVLLRNTKTQPHNIKINTHPAFAQTIPAAEMTNSVFTKPEAKATSTPTTTTNTVEKIITPTIDTKTKTQTNIEAQTVKSSQSQKAASLQQQKDIVPAPVSIAPPPITVATPAVVQPVLQTPQESETQNINIPKTQNAGAQTAETQNIETQNNVETQNVTSPQPQKASVTTTTSPAASHHRKHHHHALVADKALHRKETSKEMTATAGDKKNLMVQVGTFSLPANAATLVDKLHSKGFSAVSEKMKTSKGEMTRVLVGKKGLDHAEAETVRKSLEKSMSLNGIIISHAKD